MNRVIQGHTDSGVVAATPLVPNSLVTRDATNTLVACTTGDLPAGSVMFAYAAGKTATYYRPTGRHWLKTAGVITANAYVKCGTTGFIVEETTPTVVTAFTIGKCPSGGGSGDVVEVEFK